MDDSEKWRRYRMVARQLAFRLREALGDPEWVRAGGNCVCERCGLEFYDHPQVGIMHVLCDGRWVKL